LANGKIELTEGIVSSNEFLHAFFRTLSMLKITARQKRSKDSHIS